MRDFWLAVMLVSVVPAAAVCLLCNPLAYLLLGPDAWRNQIARVYPYRWWLGASVVALLLATTMVAMNRA